MECFLCLEDTTDLSLVHTGNPTHHVHVKCYAAWAHVAPYFECPFCRGTPDYYFLRFHMLSPWVTKDGATSLSGCLAQLNADQVALIPEGDLVPLVERLTFADNKAALPAFDHLLRNSPWVGKRSKELAAYLWRQQNYPLLRRLMARHPHCMSRPKMIVLRFLRFIGIVKV